MPYCIYLRKSRSDTETKKIDEAETLENHEKILLDLAKRHNWDIIEIYKEVVSGDTISMRPIAQKLLSDVEDDLYDGVLVMDIDRLARGDTVDQGVVARTFKYSNTKIITPLKIYDPNDEFDEEYFEFGLFMARREYKMITRRMQRGRSAALSVGKFIGSKPPYGYDKMKLTDEKGFSLKINKDESEVVKSIFDWFVYGDVQPDGNLKRLGSTLIAKKLNYLTKDNKNWLPTAVRDILKNPIYIGKLRSNAVPTIKKVVDGKIKSIRVRNKPEKWILINGLHKPIIDEETWEMAQKLMSKSNISPVKAGQTLKNPLAGILYCGKCGRAMIRHIYSKHNSKIEQVVCFYIECDNVGSKLEILEKRILSILEIWLNNYKIKFADVQSMEKNKDSETDINQTILSNIEKELLELNTQLENIHDLLEKGIYDVDKFLERSKIASNKIRALKENRENIKKAIEMSSKKTDVQISIIPKIEKIVDIYYTLQSPKEKNDLLKEVIEKAVYTRECGGRWNNPENFLIELYPRLPEEN